MVMVTQHCGCTNGVFHRMSVTVLVAQRLKRLPAVQETGFNPWIRKIPGRREWQPTAVFLPGEFHGQRSLVRYNPWDHKELGMTE